METVAPSYRPRRDFPPCSSGAAAATGEVNGASRVTRDIVDFQPTMNHAGFTAGPSRGTWTAVGRLLVMLLTLAMVLPSGPSLPWVDGALPTPMALALPSLAQVGHGEHLIGQCLSLRDLRDLDLPFTSLHFTSLRHDCLAPFTISLASAGPFAWYFRGLKHGRFSLLNPPLPIISYNLDRNCHNPIRL